MCLTKKLKDCSYEGTGDFWGSWDMWYLSFLMSLLYVVGIAGVFFNLPIIGTALRKFPPTGVVAKALTLIRLLNNTPTPVFAVFIVVIVSMFWGAIANRYQTNCQDVIDAKDEWYDNVPTYAVGGSLSFSLIEFLIKEHQESKISGVLNKLKKRFKKKQVKARENENRIFLGNNPNLGNSSANLQK